MTSHTTKRFRELFSQLPKHVQDAASRAYDAWRIDHHRKSLDFKRVHLVKPVYSVRIGIAWRALGVVSNDTIVWFWIGSHADYDNLLSQL